MIASIFTLAGPDIFIIFLILLMIVPVLCAAVHCANNPALNTGQRITWILIILMVNFLGAILYFLAAPKRFKTVPPPSP